MTDDRGATSGEAAGLARIPPRRKSGDEAFREDATDLPFDLRGFWQWSASDLVSNATRDILAEYIVALALGVDVSGVCDEWAPFDPVTPDGTRVEVKTPAFLQSWHQAQHSGPISPCAAHGRETPTQAPGTRHRGARPMPTSSRCWPTWTRLPSILSTWRSGSCTWSPPRPWTTGSRGSGRSC
jgi:hypothetical protein